MMNVLGLLGCIESTFLDKSSSLRDYRPDIGNIKVR